jgi:hypothetical protein
VTTVTINIIVASVILGLVAAGVAWVVAVMIWEAVEDRRYKSVLDDAEAHLAPLRTGSRSAERAMLRFHREHGLLLWNRTSASGRRLAAALDARRPGRPRPLRRPVWDTPPAPAVVGDERPVEVHHEDPPGPGLPALAAAPLPGEILPPADGGSETSPIGDALAAELGTTPAPPRQETTAVEDAALDDGTAYSGAPDNTTWRLMRDELFAMIDAGGEDAEVAS